MGRNIVDDTTSTVLAGFMRLRERESDAFHHCPLEVGQPSHPSGFRFIFCLAFQSVLPPT